MARATGLWAEAYTVPGTQAGIVTRKVDWIQITHGELFDPINEVGHGSLTIPAKFDRLNLVLDPPAGEYSLIRVKRPGAIGPSEFGGRTIYSFLAARFEDIEGDREVLEVGVTGPGLESLLDIPILPFDYPTTIQNIYLNPDWVWGGENLLTTTLNYTSEVIEVWTDATGGTFTLTFEGQTTTALNWNASASSIETALENLSTIVAASVTGVGSETEPWRIEILDPTGPATDMSGNGAGLTGGTLKLNVSVQGNVMAQGWEIAQRVDRGTFTPFGRHASDSPGIRFDVVDVVEGASWSLWWNGLDPPPSFPGVQYRTPVIAGGLYQARLRWRPANTTDIFRFVIRGAIGDEYIASYPASGGIAGAAAGVWETWTIPDVEIPSHITDVLVRFSYVGSGNPSPVHMNVETGTWLRTGMAETTAGDIVKTLIDDLTINHAPGFDALNFLKYDSFNASTDSNGAAWPITNIAYQAQAGKSLLQVLQDMVGLGHSFKVNDLNGDNPTFDCELKLVGDDKLGPDLPAGGTGPDGQNDTNTAIVAGANVLPTEVVKSRPTATDLVIQGGNGLIYRTTSAALADAGRIGAYISAPELLNLGSISRRAAQELAARNVEISLKPTVIESREESHSTPYYDYGVGWKVRANFPGLTSQGRRVYSIATSWNGENEQAQFVIDTDRRIFASNPMLALSRAVDLMWRKFKHRETSGLLLGSGQGALGTNSRLNAYSFTGNVFVESGRLRFRFPVPAVILGVSCNVNTAPVGASIIVDVNKNGATLFGNQNDRPVIPSSGFSSVEAVPDVTLVATDEYITVDIDQVGTTIPGGDMVVVVRWSEAAVV